SQSRRLNKNYRNTKQIAGFAAPLVDGLEPTEDDALPNFEGCDRDGERPTVIRGKYSAQAGWALTYLRERVTEDETVAFLHRLGRAQYRRRKSRSPAASARDGRRTRTRGCCYRLPPTGRAASRRLLRRPHLRTR